ncbi:MAG: 2-C-methyl-D-erythritol 4-phosphate cytidylyltransferase [Phycisphaerales bacterium]|nr:2-C-methyl-D-erythritol 4-phosphate cytidylyltransferase [Phycisphaerales bacterium]
MKIALILPAAGSSTRYNTTDALLGSSRSKLDEDLGGRPVLQRTVELFHTRPEIDTIIVAGPHDREQFADFALRHQDKLTLLGAKLIQGGANERYETVQAALEHVPEHCTHIAVHDAARPGTPAALIDRVIDVASRHHAVIPAIPVSDTIKRVRVEPIDDPGADPLANILGGSSSPLYEVEQTLDRRGLMQVQTPQVFERELLLRAYQQESLASTDDAGLVERLGERVVVVEGDERNLKITRPGDTEVLRAILGYAKPTQRATHKKF